MFSRWLLLNAKITSAAHSNIARSIISSFVHGVVHHLAGGVRCVQVELGGHGAADVVLHAGKDDLGAFSLFRGTRTLCVNAITTLLLLHLLMSLHPGVDDMQTSS